MRDRLISDKGHRWISGTWTVTLTRLFLFERERLWARLLLVRCRDVFREFLPARLHEFSGVHVQPDFLPVGCCWCCLFLVKGWQAEVR